MSTDRWMSTEKQRWADYKHFWLGRPDLVMPNHFQRIFRKSWARGCMTPIYFGILRRFGLEIAPSLAEPYRVVTERPEVKALLERVHPVVADAWQLRRLVNSCFVHYLVRDGQPQLELLTGDAIWADPDPQHPSVLQRAREIRLKLSDAHRGSELVYRRDERGLVVATVSTETTDEPCELPAMTLYPVFGFYRSQADSIVPAPDIEMLTQQVALNTVLTDLEFQRYSMPGKRWITSDHRQNVTQEIDDGPDAWLELEQGETVGVVEPKHPLADQLTYVENWLRMAAVLRGLHPETFSIKSRAETGAAKAEERRLNERLVRADWREAQRELGTLANWLRIQLGESLGWEVQQLELSPAPLEDEGSASDQLLEVQAVEARASMGIETVAQYLARRRGLSLPDAEALLARNREVGV